MSDCKISHGCTGFHDMGALACAIESAAIDGVVHEVEDSLSRYDRMVADGVPVPDASVLMVERVRVWLHALWVK